MRVSTTSQAVAHILCLGMGFVSAQTADYLVINKPTKNENIPAGSQYKVTWEPNEKYPGKVNIAVLEGADPATLQPGPNVTTEKDVDGMDGGFTWTVDEPLGAHATYGLKISLASNTSVFQYSNPFHITPSGGGSNQTSSPASSGGAGASKVGNGLSPSKEARRVGLYYRG